MQSVRDAESNIMLDMSIYQSGRNANNTMRNIDPDSEENQRASHDNEMAVKVAQHEAKPFDTVGFIMDFEDGQLDEEQIIEGFQHLINDGTVWQLQGSYGRTAASLIEAGHCTSK